MSSCAVMQHTVNPEYFVRTKLSHAGDLRLFVRMKFLYGRWPRMILWLALIFQHTFYFRTEAAAYKIYKNKMHTKYSAFTVWSTMCTVWSTNYVHVPAHIRHAEKLWSSTLPSEWKITIHIKFCQHGLPLPLRQASQQQKVLGVHSEVVHIAFLPRSASAGQRQPCDRTAKLFGWQTEAGLDRLRAELGMMTSPPTPGGERGGKERERERERERKGRRERDEQIAAAQKGGSEKNRTKEKGQTKW